MSIGKDAIKISLNSSLIVVVMVAVGAIGARYKVFTMQILNSHGVESLSQLILNILLPSLIFTQMIIGLNIEKLFEFGMLIFFCTGSL